MLPQVFHLGCSERAVRTCKGLFPSVNASMFLKVGDDGGLVRAVGAPVGLGGILAWVCHTAPPAFHLWSYL